VTCCDWSDNYRPIYKEPHVTWLSQSKLICQFNTPGMISPRKELPMPKAQLTCYRLIVDHVVKSNPNPANEIWNPANAVQRPKRQVTGFSPRTPEFNPRPVNVGFVVDRLALWQVIPRVLGVFPCQYHSMLIR